MGSGEAPDLQVDAVSASDSFETEAPLAPPAGQGSLVQIHCPLRAVQQALNLCSEAGPEPGGTEESTEFPESPTETAQVLESVSKAWA